MAVPLSTTLGNIATGTKILGGLSSIFGKKKSVSPEDSYEHSRAAAEGSYKAAMRYGLHPSMAHGGSPYSGPMSVGEATASEGLQQVGAALDEHADRKANKGMEAKQKELMDAQIAESRSRTLLNAANSRRAIYGPRNNPSGLTGGLEGMDPGPDARLGPRGVRREPTPDMPARQRVSLGKHSAQGPNPEAFEVGISELIAGALIYGPQWLYSMARSGSKAVQGSVPKTPKKHPLYRRN